MILINYRRQILSIIINLNFINFTIKKMLSFSAFYLDLFFFLLLNKKSKKGYFFLKLECMSRLQFIKLFYEHKVQQKHHLTFFHDQGSRSFSSRQMMKKNSRTQRKVVGPVCDRDIC